MTVWFSKTKRTDINDIFFFRENGQEPEESTITFKADLAMLSADDNFYYLSTYSCTSIKGFKIMNDKKADEPASYVGLPVVLAIQKVPEVTNTYKDKTTIVKQTASHKLVSELLAGYVHDDQHYKVSLSLSNNADLHEVIDGLTGVVGSEQQLYVYHSMFVNMTYLVNADLPSNAELDKLVALSKAVATPRPAYGGKGNYVPKESHAECLAASKQFVITELMDESTSLLCVLMNLGFKKEQAILEILKLAK